MLAKIAPEIAHSHLTGVFKRLGVVEDQVRAGIDLGLGNRALGNGLDRRLHAVRRTRITKHVDVSYEFGHGHYRFEKIVTTISVTQSTIQPNTVDQVLPIFSDFKKRELRAIFPKH